VKRLIPSTPAGYSRSGSAGIKFPTSQLMHEGAARQIGFDGYFRFGHSFGTLTQRSRDPACADQIMGSCTRHGVC
jgi:hypothetical protein